jgi:hypothetical protein
MLSLKEFKKYEILGQNGTEAINGGISCKNVVTIMVDMYNSGNPQYDNIVHQLQNGGIQCTDGGGNLFNMTM